MKKMLSILALCQIVCCATFAEDETYKKYQPADSKPQPQEGIDWSRATFYDAQNKKLPRVLMIGDSICNANHSSVRKALKGKYALGFWASSMDSTDPDFIYALNLILEQMPCDIITFNNGLHGHKPLPQRVVAIENAVKFIREKLPEVKLILVGTTPLKKQDTQPDRTLPNLAEKMNLPFVDLNALMSPLDREKFWSDMYHFKKAAVEMQGEAIAAAIEKEGAAIDLNKLNDRKFSPAPVVKENDVYTNIVGLNTRSKEGKRVFITGRFAHGAAWSLRAPMGKSVNISAWETSKCLSDPDYPRMLDYALSLLPYDYIMFIQPPSPHEKGKRWQDAFVRSMKNIKKKFPQSKIILCSAATNDRESIANARFMENYAKKNKLDFFAMLPDDQKKSTDFIGNTILKVLKLHKDDKGNIVQESSAMGPSGAVK